MAQTLDGKRIPEDVCCLTAANSYGRNHSIACANHPANAPTSPRCERCGTTINAGKLCDHCAMMRRIGC